ncbi:MAG: hypothetical protein SWZ49_33345 [Cyanobacteriota bacterium]|nr:hypothetical protein [Cyanobacteriota bacterium]
MTKQKQLQKKVSTPILDTQGSSEFLQTRPFAPIAQSASLREQETQSNSVLTASNTSKSVHSFGNLPIQRQVPSTKERTKNSQVGDRHMITHPFFDLGGWYKTLMTGRIADLYKTANGFLGHAQQIQQELDRLCPLINEGRFHNSTSLNTAKEYEQNIKKFIVKGARRVNFDIPKFIFSFSNNSTLAIERSDGRLLVNGKEDR